MLSGKMGSESQVITNYDHLEPIPLKHGCGLLALTFVGFQIINRSVIALGTPQVINPKDEWRWRNTLISWVHALIIGSWDILCFCLYPQLTVDLIGYHNYFIYAMVAVSTGYFFYDFVDIICNRRAAAMWEVLSHHVAVSSTFFYNLMTSRCLSYTVVALMAEINSFFLHTRKLMQMHKISFTSPVYRINVHLNLVTFVWGRFVACAWITYGMFYWRERVGEVYFVILCMAMIVMWIINIILFCRLVNNDILRPVSQHSKAENGINHLSANNNGPLQNGSEKWHSISNGHSKKCL